MRDKMTFGEFNDKYEGKDVKPSLEDGHSGKHIVGVHEQVNQKAKVKRIDNTGKCDV